MYQENAFWVKTPANLICSTTICPCDGMSYEERMNTLTRLILFVFVIMYIVEYKHRNEFLLFAITMVVINYYSYQQPYTEENFGAPHPAVPPTSIQNTTPILLNTGYEEASQNASNPLRESHVSIGERKTPIDLGFWDNYDKTKHLSRDSVAKHYDSLYTKNIVLRSDNDTVQTAAHPRNSNSVSSKRRSELDYAYPSKISNLPTEVKNGTREGMNAHYITSRNKHVANLRTVSSRTAYIDQRYQPNGRKHHI